MKQYTLNLCSFLLLVLFPAFLSAQSSFPYFEYHFPDTLPERFHYDPLQTYQSLKAIPYDTTIYTARQHERFSKAYAVAKQSDLFRGHLYVDWHALENYLNTILDSITPPHLLTQSKLHVYPTTDPTENAFSLHDGTIYFNVGLMAEIQNEAALAHVLAHEIAHYLNDDARTRFYKFLALEGTAPWFIADDLKQATQYSKQQELQADKYAHRQIKQSPFNIKAARSVFYLFGLNHRKQKYRRGSRSMQDYSTHPSHQQRLQLLNHYIDSIAQTPHSFGNHYLIDSSTFSRLQSAARYERLRQSLNRNALLSCIEYAFLKHLSFPTNPYYQYFLLEGLRRYMLLYPADTQKKFILNNYNLAQYDSSYLSHTKTGPQLADYLNFLELEISQNLSIPPSLQQSPSTDSLFPTYPDVFEYLVQQGIVQQYPESHLTLGLYYDPGNRYLSKYLSFDSIKYPSYAQHLLNNSSPPSTDSPLLVVYGLEKLELYETNRYNPEFPASSTKDIYKIALTDAGESLNKQLYYVPQRRNNLAHYLHMHDLHQTIEQLPTNENFSFSLPRLKPALWSTFQNYHTSTIEFLNVRLIHDIRKDFNLFSCNTYCFAFCGSPLHRKDDTYLKMKWQAATITDSLTISNHAIYEEEIDKVNYKSLYSGTRSFLKEHSIE